MSLRLSRRTSRVPAATALAALLAVTACGFDATPRAKPAAPGPLATETGEEPIDEVSAEALAKAGTLKEADLPGWRATPSKRSAEEVVTDHAFAACMGHEYVESVVYQAWDFSKGEREIMSSADVLPTKADVQQQLADVRDPKFSGCAEQALRDFLDLPSTVKLKPFTTKLVKVTVPGSDGAYGYVVTTGVSGPGGSVSVTIVDVGAAVGNAELNVASVGLGKTPDVATLTKLLAKAVARARKAA